MENTKELEEYRNIGTVKECRAAAEMQVAKKAKNVVKQSIDSNYLYGECPICGAIVHGILSSKCSWCPKCGQKIGWKGNR